MIETECLSKDMYQEEIPKECSNCENKNKNSGDLKELDGHLVCVNCGLIISETIIEDVEWTNYTSEGCLNNK